MRPTRARLSALLLAGVASAAVLTQGGTQAGAAEDPAGRVKAAQASVESLRELNERSIDELEEGTRQLEQTQARSRAVRAQADRTRDAADRALASSRAARTELAVVVVRNFKNPPPSTLSAVLSTEKGALSDAVLAARDREAIEGNQRDLLRKADAARVTAEGLVVGAEQLETDAVAAEREAAEQEASLRALAARNQVTLNKAFAELQRAEAAKRAYDAEQARLRELARQRAIAAAAARDRAAAAAEAARQRALEVPSFGGGFGDSGGADCTGSTSGYPNGFIPSSALCSIGGGHRLRADAAAAFTQMNAAYGGGLCVTDSYRSYAAQVDVYQRKPSLAAIPGTSNHGLGIAVDFCGGINRFGSAAHQWMVDNAGRFGWWHPFWARQNGSKPEAWHWEYTG